MNIVTTDPVKLVRVEQQRPLDIDNEEEWDRVCKRVIEHAHRETNWNPEAGPFNFEYVGQVRHGHTWHAYFIRNEDC